MNQEFKLSNLSYLFPTDEACLEEIKKLKFPRGINCFKCRKLTKHYKLTNRMAYSCEYCRNQVYPLSGTIFEKSTTPLRIWFYAFYLMTNTWGRISIIDLQKELGVTYKTAWSMSKKIKLLMSQNNADLLTESKRVFSWSIFNAFEFKVEQKKKPIND
jgi:transposase